MPQELQVGTQWVLERGGAANNNNIIIDSFGRSSGAFTLRSISHTA